MCRKQVTHRLSKSRCAQAIIFVAVDVFALLNALDDRGVGGRSPNAVLLQLFDERWFGKARLRLRGVRHALYCCDAPLRSLW